MIEMDDCCVAKLEIQLGDVRDKLIWNFVDEFLKLIINYIRYVDENIFSTITAFI